MATKGYKAKVLMGEESTYGTAAVGNYLQLPVTAGVTGGLQQGLSRSNVLQGDRNKARPYLDEKNVTLTVSLEPDGRSIGFVTKHLFGATATTVDTPAPGTQTHEQTVGDLPVGFSLERMLSDTDGYRATGCRIASAAFNVATGGAMGLTLQVIAQNDTHITAASSATPTKYPVLPLKNSSGVLRLDGTQFKVTAFSLNIDNEVNAVRTFGGGGIIGSADEGQVAVSGSISFEYTGYTGTPVEDAWDETEKSLEVEWTDADGNVVTFTLDEMLLSAAAPPIDTPQGIIISLNLEGFVDDGAAGSTIRATYVNDVLTYDAIPATAV